MAKTAVVILNYNGRAYLEQFLPGVIAFSPEADVYVADNCSTDDSVALLNEKFPQVKQILLAANNGYASGYNQALRQVDADYFILLNSDIEVTPNWITPIVSFMEENPDVAACQPKILDFNRKDHFEYAGAAGGYIDMLGYPYCRGRIFDTLEKDNGQYNTPKQVFWATGACMFIRSDVFDQQGGFDDSFFAHMEEIDLCWRINMTGKKIYCIPESKIYHVGGGTLDKSHPRKTFFNFRNHLSMVFKNSTGMALCWKLPLIVVLDTAAALLLAVKQSPGHTRAVGKAYADFIRQLGKTHKKRYQLKRARKLPLSISPSKRIIALSYYLGKKKQFNRL